MFDLLQNLCRKSAQLALWAQTPITKRLCESNRDVGTVWARMVPFIQTSELSFGQSQFGTASRVSVMNLSHKYKASGSCEDVMPCAQPVEGQRDMRNLRWCSSASFQNEEQQEQQELKINNVLPAT
eukprot:58621-Amphidinium_carterae.1